MKKVTLVMLALTAVMQLPAQEQGRTLSLEEALEMTLSDNPAIRAAEFNRRAAQQERRAAIGLRMPQIGITGSYAYLGKDIEIDLNNMKTPVQNLAGQILQSGMIPSDYIPSISQMLSGAMAASWALPLQDRSLGFVGGDVTVPLWMGGKINAANRAARINEQFAPSGYGTLDLNGWWQVSEQFSVNGGLYNLTDKQYWQWGDVQGLDSQSVALDRFSQTGRYAAVNLIWEI